MAASITINPILDPGKKLNVIVKDRLIRILMDGEPICVYVEDAADLRLEEFLIGQKS